MSECIGTVDVYDVAPTPDGRVRLSMIVKKAQFPDFAVDLAPAVALRIGKALLAHGAYMQRQAPPGMPPQGASHGG